MAANKHGDALATLNNMRTRSQRAGARLVPARAQDRGENKRRGKNLSNLYYCARLVRRNNLSYIALL